MKHYLTYFILILLCSCTNRNIIEINVRDDLPIHVRDYSFKHNPETVVVNDSKQSDSPIRNIENKDCTYVQPNYKQMPSIPKELINNTKLSKEVMNERLVDYIAELRKYIKENGKIQNESYNEYLIKCKN